jgi:hypothetical protein
MGDHPTVDLGDLQVGVHRFIDGQQLVVATEQFEIVTQVDKCRHGGYPPKAGPTGQ